MLISKTFGVIKKVNFGYGMFTYLNTQHFNCIWTYIRSWGTSLVPGKFFLNQTGKSSPIAFVTVIQSTAANSICVCEFVCVYVCVQSGFVGWNGEPLVSGWLEGKSVGLARALSHGTCDSPVPTHQRQSVPAGDFISSCLCQPCGISLTKIWRPGSFQTKGHAWRPSEVLFCLISDEWSMVTLLFFFCLRGKSFT